MDKNAPRIGRREVLQRLAAGAGGILALPLVAAGHPIERLLRDEAGVAAADSKAAAAPYAPEFLDAHQLETLQVLAERIVPGSTDAKSGEFIDQLLTVAAATERESFLKALNAFERLASDEGAPSWPALTREQQHDLLTVASTSKAAESGAPPSIRDHFDQLKGWIVGAYYSSEIGMRELGWSGTVFFKSFPGCEHADGHA